MKAVHLHAFLRVHRRVGIDTSPFIYHVENHPTYSAPSTRLFKSFRRVKDIDVLLLDDII